MSQPGPSLEKGLVTYTARKGPVSQCPAPKHTSVFMSFLAKRRDSQVSVHYAGLEDMFGGHQRDSGKQEWVLLASCDPCDRQWRMAGCRQAPATALSSPEDSILFLVSCLLFPQSLPFRFSSILSCLVQAGPERVGSSVLVHSLCPGPT